MNKQLSKKDAIAELWERGELSYKLRGKQKAIYEACKRDGELVNVVCAARQMGKSFTLLLTAVEYALQHKQSTIKYACPTKKMARDIVRDKSQELFSDCPEHLRPETMVAEGYIKFTNGSRIEFAGTDGGSIDRLRGGTAHKCFVDEAGFCDNLEYVIDNVLIPSTDTTGGNITIASTPNYLDPTHEFNINYVLPLQEAGTLTKFTIYDSPMLTPERRQQIIDKFGIDHPRFRCEYLCEVAIDPDKLVIGEFTPEAEAIIVQEHKRPPFYDNYVAMDIGFKDLTGLLFAYYDFQQDLIVIEDELVFRGESFTTQILAEALKKKEEEVFGRDEFGEPIAPFMRVADNNNLMLLNDLYQMHKIHFQPTKKDDKDAQINNLKLMVQHGKIRINPRCKNLIYHIKSAKWNKGRTSFERVKDNKEAGLLGGHVDLLDALLYLTRNVLKSRNPYPVDYNCATGPNIWMPERNFRKNDNYEELMRQIMNIKPKKGRK